jgi:hypothetical protein
MGTEFDMGEQQDQSEDPLDGETENTVFITGAPPGPNKSISFNKDNVWKGDPRFVYDHETGLLTVPLISVDTTITDRFGGWDGSDISISKIINNQGIILGSTLPNIQLVKDDITRINIGVDSNDTVFKVKNSDDEVIFDLGSGDPYLKAYADDKVLELELMKINFQSISWAQFAIYDAFSDSEKRSLSDPSPDLAAVYRGYLYTNSNEPDKSFGFVSITYDNITTIETGTSTSTGLNYLQDTTKNWYLDQNKNLTLHDSLSNTFIVDTNTSDTLTVVGTPISGSYSLVDNDPAFFIAFCTLTDSIWGGYGSIKMEISFNNGVNYQTIYETGVIELRQATVAVANTGHDYIIRFILTNDSEGNSPLVHKFLVTTDPSPWRY